MRSNTKQAIKKTTMLTVFVLLWQLLYYMTTDILVIWKPYMFPSPLGVIKVLSTLINNNVLIIAVIASMRRILCGFILSVVMGAMLGLLIYKVRLLNETLRPIFLGLQTLPSICWLPFAILWFGLNESAILFVIVIGSTFSISISVEAGLKSVNPLYIKAGNTMGVNSVEMLFYIIIPDSLPQIVVGLKQGWSFSWRALMNGEVLSATKGLGYVLILGRDLSDINQVTCIIIVIMLLGIAIDRLVFGLIEEKIRRDRGIG